MPPRTIPAPGTPRAGGSQQFDSKLCGGTSQIFRADFLMNLVVDVGGHACVQGAS